MRRPHYTHALICGLVLGLSGAAGQDIAISGRAADQPRPVLQDKTWTQLFARQKQELLGAAGDPPADLCFVGDSPTQFWAYTGQATWALDIQSKYRAVNFGIAGDRTENILFRLVNTNIHTKPPRAFIVLAGTNNLSHDPPDTPDATAVGVRAIVEHLLRRCPRSQVILLSLPPNGHDPASPRNRSVRETNARLKQLAATFDTAGNPRLTFLDIHPVFTETEPSGQWRSALTSDGTHFSEKGYEKLAETLKPVIGSLLSNP